MNCECGAKYTVNPNFHSDWCPLGANPDQYTDEALREEDMMQSGSFTERISTTFFYNVSGSWPVLYQHKPAIQLEEPPSKSPFSLEKEPEYNPQLALFYLDADDYFSDDYEYIDCFEYDNE